MFDVVLEWLKNIYEYILTIHSIVKNVLNIIRIISGKCRSVVINNSTKECR